MGVPGFQCVPLHSALPRELVNSHNPTIPQCATHETKGIEQSPCARVIVPVCNASAVIHGLQDPNMSGETTCHERVFGCDWEDQGINPPADRFAPHLPSPDPSSTPITNMNHSPSTCADDVAKIETRQLLTCVVCAPPPTDSFRSNLCATWFIPNPIQSPVLLSIGTFHRPMKLRLLSLARGSVVLPFNVHSVGN